MPGAILRAGDRVHLHGNRTEHGLIELCRWWQGEPFYKVRWPHGRRSQQQRQGAGPGEQELAVSEIIR